MRSVNFTIVQSVKDIRRTYVPKLTPLGLRRILKQETMLFVIFVVLQSIKKRFIAINASLTFVLYVMKQRITRKNDFF